MRALTCALFFLLALGPVPAGAAPFAYVPNGVSANGSVIDTATNTVVATVTVGTGPFGVGVAVPPDGGRVYVVNAADGTVSVIDTATTTVVATVAVGNGLAGVAVTLDGGRVYVVNAADGTVSVIDTATNTVVATVAVTPDGGRIYVVNAADGTASVIDTATNTVVATVPVGEEPVALGIFIPQPFHGERYPKWAPTGRAGDTRHRIDRRWHDVR